MTNQRTVIWTTAALSLILLTTVPFITNSLKRSQMSETFNNFRSLQIAMQTMLIDRAASGAEVDRDVESALVDGNYLTRSDLDVITNGYTVEYFPLAERSPPPETPMFIARGENRRVVVTYGGKMSVERPDKQ